MLNFLKKQEFYGDAGKVPADASWATGRATMVPVRTIPLSGVISTWIPSSATIFAAVAAWALTRIA